MARFFFLYWWERLCVWERGREEEIQREGGKKLGKSERYIYRKQQRSGFTRHMEWYISLQTGILRKKWKIWRGNDAVAVSCRVCSVLRCNDTRSDHPTAVHLDLYKLIAECMMGHTGTLWPLHVAVCCNLWPELPPAGCCSCFTPSESMNLNRVP